MELRDTPRMALRPLARNKLRTGLTMLGIMIGIGAVICTVAIGEGGSSLIHDQLVGLGTNLVWIEAGGRIVNGVRTGNGATKSLTVEDAMAIERSVPLCVQTSQTISTFVTRRTRCGPRNRRAGPSRSCSRASLRSLCWSAGSES
jgi:MacB-like protein